MPFKVTSGSTKVDDFGTNRKRVFDFLLVINSNLCRTSHRFGDTATYWSKSPIRTHPTLIQRPRSGLPPSNFGITVISLETRMMGLPYVEEIMIVGRTVWTQSTSVTDRRTELLSQRPCNAERRTVKILVSKKCLAHHEIRKVSPRARAIYETGVGKNWQF